MLSENVISEKAFSDHIGSGFLVLYQKKPLFSDIIF